MSPKVHKILGSVLLLVAMSNLYLYSLLLKHKQWFLDPSIPTNYSLIRLFLYY